VLSGLSDIVEHSEPVDVYGIGVKFFMVYLINVLGRVSGSEYERIESPVDVGSGVGGPLVRRRSTSSLLNLMDQSVTNHHHLRRANVLIIVNITINMHIQSQDSFDDVHGGVVHAGLHRPPPSPVPTRTPPHLPRVPHPQAGALHQVERFSEPSYSGDAEGSIIDSHTTMKEGSDRYATSPTNELTDDDIDGPYNHM